MTDSTPSAPDFDVFARVGSGDDERTMRVGAAWLHGKGRGMNLKIDRLPVQFGGRLVLFPHQEKDTETTGD